MRKFGLIGFPLTHSFSAGFFSEKFEKEGINDCSYQSYPISSIDQFSDLLIQNPELEGINVTIPYKKAVIPFLHDATGAVKKIAACNCIKISKGKLKGYNTDVIGFERSLSSMLTPVHTRALVLGTGGSAAAVEFVLEKLRIEFTFVSRSDKKDNNRINYSDLTEEIIKSHSLIINTTPLGMYPNIDSFPDIPYQFLTTDHYLFDLVYNPARTLFLQKGAEQGAVIKNGADMLLIQAEESWKIWNDKTE